MADNNESTRPHHGLRLKEAEIVIDSARAKGRDLGLGPLTVAVLDNAGRLIALKREDASSLLRPDIAQAKAFGALAMGIGRESADASSLCPVGHHFGGRGVDPGSGWRLGL